MSDLDDEGFTIHKASIAITIPRPDYKPLKILYDHQRVQDKEKKIQEIMKECSMIYNQIKPNKSCCKVEPKIIAYVQMSKVYDKIDKNFKELLGILSFSEITTEGCNLMTIAIMSSIFQEARKQEFQTFYKRNKLSDQVAIVNKTILDFIDQDQELFFSLAVEKIVNNLKKSISKL